MLIPEHEIDLSKLNLEDLRKIEDADGFPKHLVEEVDMLIDLLDNGYVPIEGADLSNEWTVPTSPRTLAKLNSLLGR